MVSGVEPAPAPAERAAAAVPDRPLASLFVTGFNQADTIREALEAALAQTWRPLDLLFSDDASEDATFEIMREVAERHQGREAEGLSVRVRRSAVNGGLVDNVNRAVAACRGELIAMSGGDDVSEPHRVETLMRAWLDSGRRAHLLHSDAAVIDARGAVVGARPANAAVLAARRPRDFMALDRCVLGAVMAWSREMFEIFGPMPPEATNEDQVITLRGAFLGPVIHVPEALVRWRTGGASWAGPDMLRHPFGPRLKFAHWRAGGARAALVDLARAPIDAEEAAAVRAEAERVAAHVGLEAELGRRPWPGRLALAPRALALALRARSRRPAVLLLKHLLRGPYARWWEARHGAPRAGDPA